MQLPACLKINWSRKYFVFDCFVETKFSLTFNSFKKSSFFHEGGCANIVDDKGKEATTFVEEKSFQLSCQK
ncbi:hypothetical protein BDF20DRAFT_926214 [Mycotypha africana]|uniref:uncharacterized protein n=1 Tax=Mycotypha africana TaxID=64632 RepID=UPI00230145FD|nr:uncharacterized protein BDF20DRAFT_926214 [Mycotypha africana]KAI8968519.1 hypothetical protein BDF20DRAFT_926214 [Mycotypha africana]